MIPEKGEGEYPLPFFVKVCKKYQTPQHNVYTRFSFSISCVFALTLLYYKQGDVPHFPTANCLFVR